MKLIKLVLPAMLVIALSSASSAQAPPPSTAPAAPAAPTTNAPVPAEPRWKEGDNCVQNTKHEVDVELKSGRHPAGPELLSATYFIPAGTSVQVVLNEPFKEGVQYFGYVERLDDEKVRRRLGRGLVSTTRVPEDHPLVKKGLAEKTDTLLTLRIPDSIGGLWKRAILYIYTCTSPGTPKRISQLTMRVSSSFYSSLVVWPAILIIYLLSALASKAADPKRVPWYRYLDPVYMTAGTDGKGSLSKLQILFFSMIVFGLLAYIVARTGVLSDLSSSILLLLGIAGVGSVAAKGTDARRNSIDFENWAWLIRKGWLPPAGWAAVNKASWHDIVTSDGEFDVYRYQSCIFSLIVGLALLAAGINELASFTIPETLLGILGLSQVVYIGGKIAAQTSVGELNSAATELRDLEKKFIDAASANPDPNPAAAGNALTVSRRRAGDESYNNYINKAKNVRLLFQSVTGRQVSDAAIEPSIES